MKKQQKIKKKGKVQKSAKPAARKKPVEKKKAKASAVKAKPVKKNNAAKPAKVGAKKTVPKKPEPKQNKISKPAVKPEKKTLAPKAVKQEKTKVPQTKEKGGKGQDLVSGDGFQKPEAPLNDRPINEKKAALYPQGEKIKLRIDSRTIITVRSKEALKMWMQRYPNAVQED